MQTSESALKNFWDDMPEEEYYTSVGVRNTQSYFNTPNGKIFTQSFLPLIDDDKIQPIKATVFMTHGYGSDTGWSFQKFCISYATWGYAVFAADLLGHGSSDGIRCYLTDLNKVAPSSLSFFISVRNSEEYKNLPAFMFGESLGALVTLLMYLQSAPAENNWIYIYRHLLTCGLLLGHADTWASMSDKEMVLKSFRDPENMKLFLKNPRMYTGKPRVGTMREIDKQTGYVQNNFHRVTAPFLTLHGTSDGVTCPTGSKMLYNKASSEDKTIKIYDGMCHSLVQG